MTGPGEPVLEELVARVRRLEVSLTALESVIQATAAHAPETRDRNAQHGDEPAPNTGGLTCPDLQALDLWVRDWLLPTFCRDAGSLTQRWCAQWWRHPEAVLRLEAMRTAFIAMTADGGTGPAAWLRDVADVQLARLFDDRGPFGDCRTEPAAKHSELPTLPAAPIPTELLEEIEASAPVSA